jgi:hypothetical protein
MLRITVATHMLFPSLIFTGRSVLNIPLLAPQFFRPAPVEPVEIKHYLIMQDQWTS